MAVANRNVPGVVVEYRMTSGSGARCSKPVAAPPAPLAAEEAAKDAALNELHAALTRVLEQWIGLRDVMLHLQPKHRATPPDDCRPLLYVVQGGRK